MQQPTEQSKDQTPNQATDQSSGQSVPKLAGIRYPAKGLSKLFFRTPLVLWRMGLGWAMPRRMLVLTTSGRMSGEPRHTMVEHWRLDGDFYITSGWGKRAQWVKNLLADPIVTVQTVGHDPVSGHAARIDDNERLARFYARAAGDSPFWQPYLASLDIEPNVDDFIAKQDRLTIIRIEPVDEVGPAPLHADMSGIWSLLGLGLCFGLVGGLLSPRHRRA